MYEPETFEASVERVREILDVARGFARALGQSSASMEHLLMALLCSRDGVTDRVLRGLGVLARELSRLVPPVLVSKDVERLREEVAVSVEVRRVVERAVREARRLGHEMVGAEHLLLGLMDERGGAVIDTLARIGITPVQVRVQTLKLIENSAAVSPFPPLPAEAATLATEGRQSFPCPQCGAQLPSYFRYCFHCGLWVVRKPAKRY